MNRNQKSLVLGMITAILITFSILVAGALISQHLSTVEFTILANRTKTVTIQNTSYFSTGLEATYHPDRKTVTLDFMQTGGFPAIAGSKYSVGGAEFTIVKVDPDYVVLIVKPSIFTMNNLFRQSITVTDSGSRSVLP